MIWLLLPLSASVVHASEIRYFPGPSNAMAVLDDPARLTGVALARVDTDTLTATVRAAALCAAVTVTRAGADLPDRAALETAGSSEILG